MTASLLGSVDRTRSGIAAGTLNSARQTGRMIGVALFGSLIAGNGTEGREFESLRARVVWVGCGNSPGRPLSTAILAHLNERTLA